MVCAETATSTAFAMMTAIQARSVVRCVRGCCDVSVFPDTEECSDAACYRRLCLHPD